MEGTQRQTSEDIRPHTITMRATKSELGSYVKVEVAVLGSPSLTVPMRGHCGHKATLEEERS